MFFRSFRGRLGGVALPYAWVPEWHESGHGLHAHFAVGRFVPRGLIERAWGHGFVHIKLLGGLPVGSGALAEARATGGYLGKYVGKDFERAAGGLHRYEVAQGFQPQAIAVFGPTARAALAVASRAMERDPVHVWHSGSDPQWEGPPAVWGAMGLTGEKVAALVEASCAAQSVPVRVSDAATVRQVATLLDGGTREHGGAAAPGSRVLLLQAPDRLHPLRVKPARTTGTDDRVVEQRVAGSGSARPTAPSGWRRCRRSRPGRCRS